LLLFINGLESLFQQRTAEPNIELIPVVDGATQNQETMHVVRSFRIDRNLYPKRAIKPIAKWAGRRSRVIAERGLTSGEQPY
jgi:biofilm PGA synthesis N-glycosyltransferase PgaC